MSNISYEKIRDDIQYEKWYDYFYKNLKEMFIILTKDLHRNNITYRKEKQDEYFNLFCSIIFNRSSKRIPKY